MGRAVGVGCFGLVKDPIVGQLGKPFIGDGGSGDVAAESFEPVTVAGSDAKSPVQGKAIESGAMFLIRREIDSKLSLAQASDPGASFWAESDFSLNGSGVASFEKALFFG